MQMKKFLMLLVLVVMCGEIADAQSLYIPRYKKKKEVRDYDLENMERKWTFTFGGGYDMTFGMQNRIHYKDYDETINYDGEPNFSGGGVWVGAGYKMGQHVVAGLEAGFLYVDQMSMAPLLGNVKVFYGPVTRQKRTRWYNYAQVGPQFYFGSSYKRVGAVAGAGVGMRVLMAKVTKVDLEIGYRCTLRRPEYDMMGKHELDSDNISYKQYLHGLHFGINFVLF